MVARKTNTHVKLRRGHIGLPALLAVFTVAEVFETIESKAGKVVRAMDRAIDAWARR
jgi:hypothetical protein